METYFGRGFAMRRSADGRALEGEVVFPADLQGPPDRAHGGGVAAACLRAAADVLAGAEGAVARALPLGVRMALKEECPLATPIRIEAEASSGAAGMVRLRGPRGIVAEAEAARPPQRPSGPGAARARWEATRHASLTVPGTAGCLACGAENPRGLFMRLQYNEEFVWKVLAPRPHFQNGDGTAFWGLAPIVLDEIGWWLGALQAREFGVTTLVEVALHGPVPAGDLIVLGSRADLRQLNKRTWRATAWLLDPAWSIVAWAQVEYAASRVYAKLLMPAFATPADRDGLRRIFPRHATP